MKKGCMSMKNEEEEYSSNRNSDQKSESYTIPIEALTNMDEAMENYKSGKVSAPINLSNF